MVRAILDGRKTQTRRIIRPQPEQSPCGWPPEPEKLSWYWKNEYCGTPLNLKDNCPYGKVGDRLRVKEGYQILSEGLGADNYAEVYGHYLADYAKFNVGLTPHEWELFRNRQFPHRPTSGRFMYKSLAYIFLEITNIRVERVQDINIGDCVAEGIQRLRGPLPPCPTTAFKDYSGKVAECGATASFRTLWDSLNAKRGYGWDKNPWLWVIEFKRMR